ncbi:MAG TPA: hypothetical protein PK657_02460, partial [Legionella sp.]|nr:hypothetical protein [Legionella sp.]
SVIKALKAIPENSKVIIDCSHSKSIAYDVVELIQEYRTNAKTKSISVETINFIEFTITEISKTDLYKKMNLTISGVIK